MKTGIRKPTLHGVADVPVVMQMEALECGAACLAMVLAYYGKWLSPEQVRADCGVSRDGSSAGSMAKAAISYGLEVRAFRYEPATLREKGYYPCIIHWNFNHFVVLRGFRGNHAYLNDPARGSIKVSMEEFNSSFTGIVLMFQPTESFVPGGKRKSTLAFARGRLRGAGAAVAFMMLTTVIALLFEFINPAFSRIFLDRLLTGENPEITEPFLIIMTAAALVQFLVIALKSVYGMKISGKMNVVGSSSFMWKLLRMPMEFFSQRMAGDLLQRQNTNATIAETVVNTLVPLVLNAVMMVIYLTVMIQYSLMLTLLGVGVTLLNIWVSRMISRRRINITRVQKRDSGMLASTTVSGIRMVETIKAGGAENGFFQKWAGYHASVNTQTVKFEKLDRYLGAVPALLTALTNAMVLVIGVWLTMDGRFTLGMIMTFQGFMNSFLTPATQLIESGQTIQEMRTDMERVEDVMEYRDDPMLTEREDRREDRYALLSGELELKDVTFGYSRVAPPVIENFSMKLKQGSRVAIVGPSGCGKSTLSKLISGLYQPWSGEILLDGQPLQDIPREVLTASVAVVDQDVILFDDTIANNIRMWDSAIEDFEMIMAAKDAQIYGDIMARRGGFDARVTEGGRNLSGGQRQRLEIARVLAQNPNLIIMDEATSALDARTEYELVNAVAERGTTCIVIAHRLSTIRNCDEIIVLDQGRIVERGTHDELYSRGGYYARLVENT